VAISPRLYRLGIYLPVNFYSLFRFIHTLLAGVAICLWSGSTIAGIDSTDTKFNPDTSRIKIFNEVELNGTYKNLWNYDYTITGFQQYYPSNNLLRTFNTNVFLSGVNSLRREAIIADLGSLGSPGKSMMYLPNTKSGLDFGFHSYDHYKFHPDHSVFYNVAAPLTELYYVVGPKQEQMFSVLHTQNISKLVNAGVSFQKGGTEGVYSRQEGQIVNFRAFTSIDSKNQRYHLNAQAIWSELSRNQNGGLTADSLFEDSTSIQKENVPVKLTTAQSAETQKVYKLTQSFDFGKSWEEQVNDSVTEIRFEGKFRFYHTAGFDKRTIRYGDSSPDTLFYDRILIDSFRTDNQIHMQKFTNTIGFRTLDFNPVSSNKINAGLSATYEYIEYNRLKKDSFINNTIVQGSLSNSAHANLYWNISGDYTLDGINSGDYRGEIKLKYMRKKRTQYLDYLLAVQQRAPAMINYSYEGNHFTWNNSFLKQFNASAMLQYTFVNHNARIGVRGDIIGRLIYFGEEGAPQQETNDITILSGYIMKDFNWKHFSIKNRIQYQIVSESTTLRLPTFIASGSAFYHNYLFKKALYMQIGIDVLYNSSYFADAYVPSTHQFRLQNVKEIGNYPYVDIFVNFKINQAKFFVKAAHVNQGLLPNTYYAVPHYPRNDLSLVAGVAWRFSD